MSDNPRLDDVRAEIDRIDVEIQDLISARAQCARQVAQAKNISNDTSSYYRPEREAQVLRAVMKRNEGPLSDESMARLFREVMSACLALQHPMRVAYLGPEGSYTQSAVYKHFGHAVHAEPMSDIDEVFREVESGNIHYGVVPIENSTEGAVNYTLDMFMHSPLKICSEVELRIHHYLMGKMDDPQQATQICAHQQALAQCRHWLDENFPDIERVAVSSNAEAARRAGVTEGMLAIAGESAADIYNLNIFAGQIEDLSTNVTRFLVIGQQAPLPSGQDKTSILFSAPNQPGVLSSLLKPFADHNISLTSIESRPSRQGVWDYVFFIDVMGHMQDANVAAALAELGKDAAMLKVLGSYPTMIV